MHRITELGREFGLSRSTLLYYHRIGLLAPAIRTRAEHRLYAPEDRDRLARICMYRQAGLSLQDIRTLLDAPQDRTTEVLQRRLAALGGEIRLLQSRQRLIADMLRVKAAGWQAVSVDKATWVAMLRAAGMKEAGMDAWHAEFESRAPAAHHAFLASLGIGEAEILRIRAGAQ
jgi:DNA-binding transcriptional MerR regulator